MFLIIGYSRVIGMSTTRKGVGEILEGYHQSLLTEAERRNRSRDFDAENYIGTTFKATRVYEVPNTYKVNYATMHMEQGVTDISGVFFEVLVKPVAVGHTVTAVVIKKGLRSTGQRVQVLGVAGKGITEPSQMKEYFDQMTRVSVHVTGYGAISMGPTSLDDYESTPVMVNKQVLSKLW